MHRTILIVISQFLICLNLFAQDDHIRFECGEAIHGVDIRHFDITDSCSNSSHLLITSYAEDGPMGTIVSGAIRAENIRITPGNSRVRLAPIIEFTPYHKRHKKSTTAGGNGNAGARYHEVLDISMSNEDHPLTIYPNPVFDVLQVKANSELKIIGFDLLSADGKTLKQESIPENNKISFSTIDLEEGIYFIHIQLKGGEVYHKTILKR